MKQTILLIGLLLVNLCSSAQLDETYFLLGAQMDYMGRTFFKNHPTTSGLIIEIHQDDPGEIGRIEEITGLEFIRRESSKNCKNCHEFYELHSIELSEALTRFYSIKRWSMDEAGNRLDKGIIKCKKIESASLNQKMSFLAGQFLISGMRHEHSYKITLSNSPERFDCLCEILKDLDCRIRTKEFHYLSPNVHNVYFEPSKGIKELLDNEIEKRNTLANN